MKTTLLNTLATALVCHATALAALNVPSDGSDGALNIAVNTEIDLGLAVTGNWDANNSANAGKGIYDPAKWAVVFKYSTITIAEGATVTFKNHSSRAPVVWLASGNVTINGTVKLDGQGLVTTPELSEPGPGGFRGGSGNFAPGATEAAGFGPGGGGRRTTNTVFGSAGGAGSHSSVGLNGPPAYGNPSLIPLVGGSGGGGREGASTVPNGYGGAAGGGAILVACAGDLTISASGTIRANGGSGKYGNNTYYSDHASGSGGGIRLVAESLSGSGIVQALGGAGYYTGGLGRIRIERVSNTSALQVSPDPSIVPLTAGSTPQLWMPDNGPVVRIVSIGGNPPPADPRAEFGSLGADVSLPQVTTTAVVIETTNVESASVVSVRVTPRSDGNFTSTVASLSQTVSTDPLVLRWTANVPVKNGYAAMQVKVVRP